MDPLNSTFSMLALCEAQNGEKLVSAVWAGRAEEVCRIVETTPACVHVNDDEPLRIAAELGHDKIVKILLSNKADPKTRDNQALVNAAVGGFKGIVETLLEHGADPHARGDLPYWSAVYNGREAVASVIRAHMGPREPQNQPLYSAPIAV